MIDRPGWKMLGANGRDDGPSVSSFILTLISALKFATIIFFLTSFKNLFVFLLDLSVSGGGI